MPRRCNGRVITPPTSYQFAVYQPQISSWPGNQLSGRFVVAARPAGTTSETYGIVSFQARTDIDKANRLVTLEDFQITKLDFPTHPAMEDQYRTMLMSSLEQSVKMIPLDHLEAILSVSSDMVKAKAQEVMNVPPEIFYSTVPSLLVLVDGPPVLQDLKGNYQRVINTRNVLLFNQTLKSYYLFADNQWFAAPALTGRHGRWRRFLRRIFPRPCAPHWIRKKLTRCIPPGRTRR